MRIAFMVGLILLAFFGFSTLVLWVLVKFGDDGKEGPE